MKTLKKYLPILTLVLGFSTNVFAQTFVVMRVTIEGSVNGTHPSESTITSITGTYSSAIQTLTVGPDTPNSAGGSSGFTYFDSTGVLTFNLSNFGSSLIFAPSAFTTAFQFDVQIFDYNLNTNFQDLSTGLFTIPASTFSGQLIPVNMGILPYDDSPFNGTGNSPLDPTPPNISTPPNPSAPIVGTPVIYDYNGNFDAVKFLSPSGGTIGGMFPSSGNESMSIISATSQVITSQQGNLVDVSMIWDINGCFAPPYEITFNVPQAMLGSLAAAGAIDIGISHNYILYSITNGNLTVLNGNLDGTDPNGAQVQFEVPSCSPFYLQDAYDDPLGALNFPFLEQPQNLTIEILPNSNNVELTWDSVFGATYYKVLFGNSPNSFQLLSQPNTNQFIHTNALINTNKKFFYKVIAKN